MKYYAYLNIENVMVAWEVAIGRIISSKETNLNGGISLWLYTIIKSFSKNIGNRKLNREIKLELFRLKKYPDQVSRLSGVFLFDDLRIAKECLKNGQMIIRKNLIITIIFLKLNLNHLI